MSKISRRSFLAIFQRTAPFLVLAGRPFGPDRKEPAAPYPSCLGLHKSGQLNARAERLLEIYENCTLCPRDCRVNRYINLMRQYRPEYKAFDFPELSRRITSDEHAEALRLAQKYGLTRLD